MTHSPSSLCEIQIGLHAVLFRRVWGRASVVVLVLVLPEIRLPLLPHRVWDRGSGVLLLVLRITRLPLLPRKVWDRGSAVVALVLPVTRRPLVSSRV